MTRRLTIYFVKGGGSEEDIPILSGLVE